MSCKVHMIGNNFELLDHVRIVRITGGGMFRIFYHVLLFVWKNLGWNDDPTCKDWRDSVPLGRSGSCAGDSWKDKVNLMDFVSRGSVLICRASLFKTFFFLLFFPFLTFFIFSIFASFLLPNPFLVSVGTEPPFQGATGAADPGVCKDVSLGDMYGEQLLFQTLSLRVHLFLKLVARANACGGIRPVLFSHPLTPPFTFAPFHPSLIWSRSEPCLRLSDLWGDKQKDSVTYWCRKRMTRAVPFARWSFPTFRWSWRASPICQLTGH